MYCPITILLRVCKVLLGTSCWNTSRRHGVGREGGEGEEGWKNGNGKIRKGKGRREEMKRGKVESKRRGGGEEKQKFGKGGDGKR